MTDKAKAKTSAGVAGVAGVDAKEGWKEAAIAWEVCASVHLRYAKGKDALFKTRQADFLRHAEEARARYLQKWKGSNLNILDPRGSTDSPPPKK